MIDKNDDGDDKNRMNDSTTGNAGNNDGVTADGGAAAKGGAQTGGGLDDLLKNLTGSGGLGALLGSMSGETGGDGAPGISGIMSMISGMMDTARQKKEALRRKTFSASSGGGMVDVTVNGNSEILSMKIDKDVIDPNDPEMLEDLVVAAVNSALSKVRAETKNAGAAGLDGLLGGLPIPPGLFG